MTDGDLGLGRGRDLGEARLVVEPGKVRELLRALLDAGAPADELPPTVSVLSAHEEEGGLIGPALALGLDVRRLLHGEVLIERLGPLAPRTTLTGRRRIVSESVREGARGGRMRLLTLGVDFADPTGRVVLRHHDTWIERAPTPAPASTAPPGDPAVTTGDGAARAGDLVGLAEDVAASAGGVAGLAEDVAAPAGDAAAPAGDLAAPAGDLAAPAGDLAPPAGDGAPPAGDLAPPAEDLTPPARDVAPPAEDLTPPAGARPRGSAAGLGAGTRMPEHTTAPLSRTDIVRYAGAGGDFNPIHHDEPFARAAGHPTVFSMGLLQGGVLAQRLAAWVGADAIIRLRLRFTGLVWPGDPLTLTGEVESVTGGVAELRLAATVPGRGEVVTATARVRTSDPPSPRGL